MQVCSSCKRSVDWKDERSIGITKEAMISLLIRVIADTLVEVIHPQRICIGGSWHVEGVYRPIDVHVAHEPRGTVVAAAKVDGIVQSVDSYIRSVGDPEFGKSAVAQQKGVRAGITP